MARFFPNSPEETGLEEFFESVDGLIMGRGTYDFVFQYGSWPYESKPTWVLTHRDIQALPGAVLFFRGRSTGNEHDSRTEIRCPNESTESLVLREASDMGLKHLWLVGGGRLASSFLEQGLISDIKVAMMPITLGQGIPLFADHQLDRIEYVDRKVIERRGFQQVELLLQVRNSSYDSPCLEHVVRQSLP